MVIQVCLCEVENKAMIVMIVVFIFNEIIVAFAAIINIIILGEKHERRYFKTN